MKTLAITMILAGLLSAGSVFAADSQEGHYCQSQCACPSHAQQTQTKTTTPDAPNIAPLSGLYETSGG